MNLLLFNQRNGVGVDIDGGCRRRGRKLDGDAHWVGEGGDRGVIINTGGVQGIKEINESVVYEFF